jgi:hypothetical protein
MTRAKPAYFVYLLAATDAHSNNFSLLYGRGPQARVPQSQAFRLPIHWLD